MFCYGLKFKIVVKKKAETSLIVSWWIAGHEEDHPPKKGEFMVMGNRTPVKWPSSTSNLMHQLMPFVFDKKMWQIFINPKTLVVSSFYSWKFPSDLWDLSRIFYTRVYLIACVWMCVCESTDTVTQYGTTQIWWHSNLWKLRTHIW